MEDFTFGCEVQDKQFNLDIALVFSQATGEYAGGVKTL